MTEQGSGVAQPPYPREPNVHSGGEQDPGSGDRPLPPYDDGDLPGQPGRQTTGKSQDELIQERGGTGKSDVGPRDVTQTEREGVGDADLAPKGPHQVGQTTTTSGEDLSSGMSEAGHTEDRLDSGLSDESNKATDSPATSSGDQGG